MSGASNRMPIAQARPIAEAFVREIAPYCERVAIAGSIRRGATMVGDIEVVAVPKVEAEHETDMFGETVATRRIDRLHEHMGQLLNDRTVQQRPRADGAIFWGPKAKYLVYEGIPVDLFTPEAARFGVILAIRTGPWTYSRRLVTTKDKTVQIGTDSRGRPLLARGLMPECYRVQDGWLTWRVSGERIPTPEESDLFALLGLEYRDPELRR